MAAKNAPRPKAPVPARKKTPTQPARVSKGAQVKATIKPAAQAKRDVSFKGRVLKVERGEAEVVKNTTQAKRDPFALPDIGALPDLAITLPSLGEMPDPIADAASEERVFGPDLTESPITEDDETLTNEDQEAVRLAELHGGFRARMEAESKRRELATDTEFWFAVVFQDRVQKDQFLREIGWEDLGDKYLDGERLATRLGVAVDKSAITYNIGGADPKLVALVGIDPLYGSEPNQAQRKRKSR